MDILQGLMLKVYFIGVFPKWSRTFIKFNDLSEFRESDRSLKHEFGSN